MQSKLNCGKECKHIQQYAKESESMQIEYKNSRIYSGHAKVCNNMREYPISIQKSAKINKSVKM